MGAVRVCSRSGKISFKHSWLFCRCVICTLLEYTHRDRAPHRARRATLQQLSCVQSPLTQTKATDGATQQTQQHSRTQQMTSRGGLTR